MVEKVELILTLKDQQFLRAMARDNKAIAKNTKGLNGLSGSVVTLNQSLQLASAGLRVFGRAFRVVSEGIKEAVKAASDFAETNQKFNVVFRSVASEAESMSKTLVDTYGFSERASKELLGSTGDLLTGFGFTSDEAIKLSGEVSKLAADLASFANFQGGTVGAVQALNKALVGERESVKALGIVIREEAVAERVRLLGKKDITGAELLQAKAQASLTIAFEQSKNAIGDVVRTSQQYANQVRFLTADIDDLQVMIGNKFLSVAENIIPLIGKIVAETNSWVVANEALIQSLSVDAFQGLVTSIDFISSGLIRVTQGLVALEFAFDSVFLAGAIAFNGIGKAFTGLLFAAGAVSVGLEKVFKEAFAASEIAFNEFLLGVSVLAQDSDILKFLLPEDAVADIEKTTAAISDKIKELQQNQSEIPTFTEMLQSNQVISEIADMNKGMDDMVKRAVDTAAQTKLTFLQLGQSVGEVERLSSKFKEAAESAREIRVEDPKQAEENEAKSRAEEDIKIEANKQAEILQLFKKEQQAKLKLVEAFRSTTAEGQRQLLEQEHNEKINAIATLNAAEFASAEEQQQLLANAKLEKAAELRELEAELRAAEFESQLEEAGIFQQSLADAFNITGQNTADVLATMGDGLTNVFRQTEAAVASTFTGMIQGTKTAREGMKALGSAILETVVQSLVRVGIQTLINKAIGKTTAISAISSGAGTAFTNAYASTAAIPIVGPLLAPAVAAQAGSASLAGGLGFLGSFAAGSDSILADGLAMLHRNERIVPAETNQDLTSFLENGGGGGPNVTVIIDTFIGTEEFADEITQRVSDSAEFNNIDFRG